MIYNAENVPDNCSYSVMFYILYLAYLRRISPDYLIVSFVPKIRPREHEDYNPIII